MIYLILKYYSGIKSYFETFTYYYVSFIPLRSLPDFFSIRRLYVFISTTANLERYHLDPTQLPANVIEKVNKSYDIANLLKLKQFMGEQTWAFFKETI